ncbi:hypothetical protein D9Y22_20365 [Methylorubrum sp. DB1722]|nr:hypothetical protein [Methylorubrum sp. DB1722]
MAEPFLFRPCDAAGSTLTFATSIADTLAWISAMAFSMPASELSASPTASILMKRVQNSHFQSVSGCSSFGTSPIERAGLACRLRTRSARYQSSSYAQPGCASKASICSCVNLSVRLGLAALLKAHPSRVATGSR